MPGYGCGKKKSSKALESPLKPAGSELSRAEEKKKTRRLSSAFTKAGQKYGEGIGL